MHLLNLGFDLRTIATNDRDLLTGFDSAIVNATNANSANIVIVLNAGDLNLQALFRIAMRRWNVLEQGIERMTWTFDPLQSVNAYFNFNKLGVVSNKYFVNFYGEDAASFLHRNGTDRLWVTWLLTSRHVHERLDGPLPLFEIGNVSHLVEVGTDRAPLRRGLNEGSSNEQAVIEIPADINDVEQKSSEIASQWREATRGAFTEAFAAGYFVEAFHRGNRGDQKVGRYLLNRGETLGDIE